MLTTTAEIDNIFFEQINFLPKAEQEDNYEIYGNDQGAGAGCL